MKIVIKDNYDREDYSETCLCTNINEHYGKEIVSYLNNKYMNSDSFYVLEEDDYELRVPDFVKDYEDRISNINNFLNDIFPDIRWSDKEGIEDSVIRDVNKVLVRLYEHVIVKKGLTKPNYTNLKEYVDLVNALNIEIPEIVTDVTNILANEHAYKFISKNLDEFENAIRHIAS